MCAVKVRILAANTKLVSGSMPLLWMLLGSIGMHRQGRVADCSWPACTGNGMYFKLLGFPGDRDMLRQAESTNMHVVNSDEERCGRCLHICLASRSLRHSPCFPSKAAGLLAPVAAGAVEGLQHPHKLLSESCTLAVRHSHACALQTLKSCLCQAECPGLRSAVFTFQLVGGCCRIQVWDSGPAILSRVASDNTVRAFQK